MIPKLNCILVIDDDEATNFFTQMILEQSGCTRYIKIVESGRAALDYLLSSTGQECNAKHFPCPDLILLDINMPAMNGWEFLEEYKKLSQESRGKIMTVMLTTSLFPEDLAKANKMPEISGFEHKPLTTEKLEKILQTHFAADDTSNLLSGDDVPISQLNM